MWQELSERGWREREREWYVLCLSRDAVFQTKSLALSLSLVLIFALQNLQFARFNLSALAIKTLWCTHTHKIEACHTTMAVNNVAKQLHTTNVWLSLIVSFICLNAVFAVLGRKVERHLLQCHTGFQSDDRNDVCHNVDRWLSSCQRIGLFSSPEKGDFECQNHKFNQFFQCYAFMFSKNIKTKHSNSYHNCPPFTQIQSPAEFRPKCGNRFAFVLNWPKPN